MEGENIRIIQDDQLRVDGGVHKARSSADRTPVSLTGKRGFEAIAKIPPRLHLSSNQNIDNSKLEIKNIKNKKEQAHSSDKTSSLTGNPHINKYSNNDYINFSNNGQNGKK